MSISRPALVDAYVGFDDLKDAFWTRIAHSETLFIVSVHDVGDKVLGEGNTTVKGDLHLDVLDTPWPGMITVKLLDNKLDHFWYGMVRIVTWGLWKPSALRRRLTAELLE